MADVEISYNNSVIASLNDIGTEVLETNGKLCTDDITVAYTKSGGGGGVEVDTCTINISTMQLSTIWATRIVDNTIVTSIVEPENSNSYTIQDVVCGSYMRVHTPAYILTGFSSINGSSHVFEDRGHNEHMIQVTTASTDTIRLWDDD